MTTLKNKNGFPVLDINFKRIQVKSRQEIREGIYQRVNDLRQDYSVGGFEREIIEGARRELTRR